MTREKKLKVGDTFTLRPGVVVTVVEYKDCSNIRVEDDVGNSRIVCASYLRRGKAVWCKADGSLRKGLRGTSPPPNSHEKRKAWELTFPVGSVWNTYKSGQYEIVGIVDSTNATIRWLDDGVEESNVTLYNIKMRMVAKTKAVGRADHRPVGNYVYVVTSLGEVVYVGMGKGDRYKHCTSGKSTSVELNRLRFQDAPLIVEVYKDNLSREDAIQLEAAIIRQLKPRCNINLLVDRSSRWEVPVERQ